MTQLEFDIICKLIQNGAPALANELITAFSNVINEAKAVVAENAKLKDEIDALKSCECSCDSCDK